MFAATTNAFAQASFETIDGLRYLLDSDAKTASVVASNGDKYSGDIVVPEKVTASDGAEYAVTALGNNAFDKCYQLKNITIPSSVTSFGDYCFWSCSSLKSIIIPSSVTSLGNYCFGSCRALSSITIPSSVTSLGIHCFNYCTSLTSIIIPSSITSLPNDCFYYCSSLISISIPSSVTSLGRYCFDHCSSLSSIIIPSSVTSLGDYCFTYCSSLSSISIPSSVTSLGQYCFQNCSSLTDITIPSSVTSLGQYCFQGCSSLELVTFKGNVPKNISKCSLPTTCIIYVPQEYLQDYKDALGSDYSYIYASKESGEDTKVEQCAAPTISYSDGKLQFASTTENAKYHYTITDTDFANDAYSEDGTVTLSAAYNISAYATADGYSTSEKSTATLYWINANLETTNINPTQMRGIVVSSRDGIVSLSGLDQSENVSFYTPDGTQISKVKAIGGVASQAVSSYSVVIAKVGGQAIKIAVK